MFTIQHIVYVIKQSLYATKMFTNERLFTIQAFTITRVHCTNLEFSKERFLKETFDNK